LREIGLHDVQSQGYCFQIDLALRALRAGLTVAKVPITFIERTRGTSKMSGAIISEAFWRVTRWGIAARLRKRPGFPGRFYDWRPNRGYRPSDGARNHQVM
jgi:dolichol-phosphate mannosyltransferase